MSAQDAFSVPGPNKEEAVRLYDIRTDLKIRAEFWNRKAMRALNGFWEGRAVRYAYKCNEAARVYKKADDQFWDFIHLCVPDTLHGTWSFDPESLSVSLITKPINPLFTLFGLPD